MTVCFEQSYQFKRKAVSYRELAEVVEWLEENAEKDDFSLITSYYRFREGCDLKIEILDDAVATGFKLRWGK